MTVTEWRMYVQDLVGGAPRNCNAFDFRRARALRVHVVSPDGKFAFRPRFKRQGSALSAGRRRTTKAFRAGSERYLDHLVGQTVARLMSTTMKNLGARVPARRGNREAELVMTLAPPTLLE